MRTSICFILMVAAPLLCLAQSESATLSGRVTDPSSGAVSGAEVVLTNTDTNTEQRTKTNNAGLYVFIGVRPGRYRVAAGALGFKTVIKGDLVLHVQDEIGQNFSLPLGSVSETVTVTGGAPLVNTDSGAVATVVDRQFIENIPLNGRSFQSLITLTPGIVTVPATATANTAGQFSVNGQRAFSNTFMVDGVSANVGAAPGYGGGPYTSGNSPTFSTLGTTQSLASVDALQEFRVQTSTYSAEYGRQPGGQISIVTRSGANQFHGNLFEYLRNDILDANDWFADTNHLPKAQERQNDFGGTFGGPVLIPGVYNGQDHTFFFVSYEGLRLRQPNFALTNVPSLCMRGLGSCAAGQTAAVDGIQPVLNAFPLPNGKNLANGFAEFTASYSDRSSLDTTSIRIDHTFNSKFTIFGRYNTAPSETVQRRPTALSDLGAATLKMQTVTVGSTLLLSPRLSNELRANYTKNGAYQIYYFDTFGGAVVPPISTLIPTPYNIGPTLISMGMSVPGYDSPSAPALIATGHESDGSQRQFNLIDNVSYTVGAHRFKFGADYRHLSPILFFSSYVLAPQFTTQQQVLTGTAGTASIISLFLEQPLFYNFSAYAQDNWKITPRLTLDLGLRWDLNPPPGEAHGHLPVAVTQTDNLATMDLAPLGTKQWNTSYRNFAPRLGFAYQIAQTPGRETVFRGGFGLFYDTGNDYGAQNFARYPYQALTVVPNLQFPLSLTQTAPAQFPLQTGIAPPYPQMLAFDPSLSLPRTYQWNVAIQQALGGSQSLTVTYVGAGSRNLLQETNLTLNTINPKFTAVYLTKNGAKSDYDALQAQFQRRISHGWQALASYSWSHALDGDSASQTGRIAQQGNADFDVRQVFSAATTYDIPALTGNPLVRAITGHWSLDTTFHAQTGLPVDLIARTQTNPIDGTLVNVRPSVLTGVPFYVDDPNVPGGRKINSAAFVAPPVGQSGNFGRNQVRGIGAWQTDFAFQRRFTLTERVSLQARGEAFNLFNHPNFGAVQTSLTAANFGQPTNMLGRQLGGISQLYQIGGPRSLQFALKLMF